MDRSDLDEIFREHCQYIYLLARRLTRSPAEADDVVQETFLRAFRFISGYRGGSMKGWLRRIAVNVVWTRTRKASQTTPVADPASHLQDSETDPDRLVEAHRFSDPMEQALASLAEEFRVTLVLREVEELTYDEISELLEVPVGTVRSRLSRARTLLRQKLLEMGTFQAPERL